VAWQYVFSNELNTKQTKTLSNKFTHTQFQVQGTGTIFMAQMQAFHVFREVQSVLASTFLTLYHSVSQVVGMNRQNLK
jgi:hypothetical protein